MCWAASDVSPSSHLAFHIPTLASFCLLFVVLLFGFVALVCFCFLFCECLGIPNSPRSLDLDDRQGLIARSAMQQKKKKKNLLYAAWVRSRAERPSVSYTKVVMEVAWTGHNLQFTKTDALATSRSSPLNLLWGK